MTTPNWQHNSGKPQKRKLKPQALRQAKSKAKIFLSKMDHKNKQAPNRGFFNGHYKNCPLGVPMRFYFGYNF